MRFGIFIFWQLLLLSGLNASSGSPYYFEVEAAPGDGIFSLLRRYQLLEPSCNLEFFLQKNTLKLEDPLITGKKYMLPVLIYRYDGASIRSTIVDQDWDKAVRIKRYNEGVLSAGLRSTHYQKSHILWVPHHEIHCTENVNKSPALASNNSTPEPQNKEIKATPVSRRTITAPMLGKKYEDVEILSDKLSNKVFYLVSGHGGPDPGAMAHRVDGNYTLCEDEYAYDVTLRLARRLMQEGAIVHMLVEDPNDGIREVMYLDCDNDEKSLGKDVIPVSQKLRLRQRTNEINKLYKKHQRKGIKDQVVLSIHVDSRSASQRQDVFFYYYSESNSGKILADRLQETFHQKYIQYQGKSRDYGGTVSSRPLFILRNSWPTAVFVELANIRNAQDRKRILEPSNRQHLAEWLYEGLIK